MFKRNHKAKTQLTNDQTPLAYDLTSFSTYFINQIVRIKEMIKDEMKKKKLNIQPGPRTENQATGKMKKSATSINA